jgi:hypothetical protein
MTKATSSHYSDWKPQMEFRESKRSDAEVLSEAETGQLRYLHAGQDATGALRYRFVLACQAEGIPTSEWPNFGTLVLPDPMEVQIRMPSFEPPPFDVLRDSAKDWRERAEKQWADYCQVCLPRVRHQIDLACRPQSAFLYKLARHRKGGKVAPIELRLRWAALHYCSGWSYQTLYQRRNPGGHYTLDAITRATQRLLRKLGLDEHQ